jgi:hypothetical protein
MSYENPQRQVISTAPAFQNLQQNISSAVNTAAAGAIDLAKRTSDDLKEKQKQLEDLFTKAQADASVWGGSLKTAETNSSIPVDLSLWSAQGKKELLIQKMRITPGSSPEAIADAQQKIENINAIPDKATQLFAWVKGYIDTTRDGLKNKTLSSLSMTNDPAMKALAAAASNNTNAVKYSTKLDANNNPILVINGHEFKYDDLKRADLQGGLVKLIPDVNSNLESTKKKAPNVFNVITTKNKDGKSVSETDGTVTNTFLTGEPYLKITSVTKTGGKVTEESGIRVVKVNKEAIAMDPTFIASTNAIANGLLADPADAYSANNDKMKEFPDADIKPLKLWSECKTQQEKDNWRIDFISNWKKFTLASIKDEQPIKNEAGNYVTETRLAPKADKGGGNGGGKPTEGSISRGQFNTNISSSETTPVYFPSSTRLSGRLQYDDATQTWGYYTNQSAGTGTENWMLDPAFGTSKSKKALAKKIYPGLFTNLP